MRKTKENSGITLVALIVTIIVLLILAAVSVKLIGGSEGILGKASNAINKYKIAKKQEKDVIDEYENAILSKYSGNISSNNNGSGVVTTREITSIDNIYPVGSVYISVTNTNPSSLFGGTWEQICQGRTIIGAGTGTDINNTNQTFELNQTGGEYTHTLTQNQLPKIEGKFGAYVPSNHGVYRTGVFYDDTIATNSSNAPSLSFTTNNIYGYKLSFGNDESHNIVQPYLVVYMWKRTA